MTIYKLSINEVENPTSYAIVSSHISPRRLRSVEFYLNEDRAKVRKQEIYEGARKLVGFLPNIEVCIDKLEVIE